MPEVIDASQANYLRHVAEIILQHATETRTTLNRHLWISDDFFGIYKNITNSLVISLVVIVPHVFLQRAFDVLAMTVRQRKPTGALIFHSDRGCQYASAAYRTALTLTKITPSMSRKGCCYDNAVAEIFFHSLKTEWARGRCYATRATAQLSIFSYIETFYNRVRRHSTINYLSPNDYELQSGIAA